MQLLFKLNLCSLYIRQANVCKNEGAVYNLFDTIRNIFSASDPKSYAYRHIQGIVKMVLNGALIHDKKGNVVLSRDGTPKLDDDRLFKLMQRINLTAKEEEQSGIKHFDNSFRVLGNNDDNTFDQFVNVNELPSLEEYFKTLLEKYTEFVTPTGYNIVRIPNFSVAKQFNTYSPGLCYLHRMSKYNTYGGDNRIFLALKPNLNSFKEIPVNRKTFRDIGRMNEFATSAIGIAVKPFTKADSSGEIVTVTSRYKWTKGATNYDYDFNELSSILGFNVKYWLMNEFNTKNIILNLPGV